DNRYELAPSKGHLFRSLRRAAISCESAGDAGDSSTRPSCRKETRSARDQATSSRRGRPGRAASRRPADVSEGLSCEESCEAHPSSARLAKWPRRGRGPDDGRASEDSSRDKPAAP